MIQALAVLDFAGVGHQRMLTTADAATFEVEQLIASSVLDMRADHEAARAQNLANLIANAVGKMLGG